MATITKRDVDSVDYQALLDLFNAVTGINPNTVLEGSLEIHGVPDGDSPVAIVFQTIERGVPNSPRTLRSFAISPAHKIGEQQV
ncbi:MULTISPECIES: hypothetical protein [unclassified Brevibacterium]|uniref:hypothetical protein n=1 Tax=unclassified Brevibacterium TaxID=2614124 RepID=UPI001E56024B|nr:MULTISPECIES: hypothetical protein [unclassified Brevibacterium]MCD1286510.1 hypothetical protein [Brevibacterium sp. CCUG 69071]MDK8434257.1 hypothetical protein [Brevibacterium sp. H-BE7]